MRWDIHEHVNLPSKHDVATCFNMDHSFPTVIVQHPSFIYIYIIILCISPLPYAGAKKLKSEIDDFADAPTVRDAVDKLASGETWIVIYAGKTLCTRAPSWAKQQWHQCASQASSVASVMATFSSQVEESSKSSMCHNRINQNSYMHVSCFKLRLHARHPSWKFWLAPTTSS